MKNFNRGLSNNRRPHALDSLLVWFVVATGWFCHSCASLMTTEQDDLPSVVDRFHHDLRWQYHQAAISRVDPAHAANFLELLQEEEKNLHIAEWEIRNITISPNNEQAEIRVYYQYYKMPSTILQQETVNQKWKRINGQWRLLSQEGGPFIFPPSKPVAEPDSSQTHELQ